MLPVDTNLAAAIWIRCKSVEEKGISSPLLPVTPEDVSGWCTMMEPAASQAGELLWGLVYGREEAESQVSEVTTKGRLLQRPTSFVHVCVQGRYWKLLGQQVSMEERNTTGMCCGYLFFSLVSCSASPSSSKLLLFEQGFLIPVWSFIRKGSLQVISDILLSWN